MRVLHGTWIPEPTTEFVQGGQFVIWIDEMIEDKKKLAGAIVEADESWLTELDNESFRSLIALNKQAILD